MSEGSKCVKLNLMLDLGITRVAKGVAASIIDRPPGSQGAVVRAICLCRRKFSIYICNIIWNLYWCEIFYNSHAERDDDDKHVQLKT